MRPFSGDGAEFKVSSDKGTRPFWSPEGDAIYFRDRSDGEIKLMRAEVISGSEAGPDNPSAKFETAVAKVVLNLKAESDSAALTPDGKSLLVIAPAASADGEKIKTTDDPAVIHIVRNFFTELERLAPYEEEKRGGEK